MTFATEGARGVAAFVDGKKSGAQLSLDELHQLKWLLGGLLTLLAVSTISYMDIDSWELMGLTSIGAIVCTVWPGLPGARARRSCMCWRFR